MKPFFFFALLLTLCQPICAASEPQLDHTWGTSAFSTDAMAFSPDAQKLAVAGSDGVKIYQSATGKVLETRAACRWRTQSVAWSRDGKTLAAGGLSNAGKWRGEIVIWRPNAAPKRFFCDEAVVASLDFSPDGRFLTSATAGDLIGEGERGALRIWDVQSGAMRTFAKIYGVSAAVRFAPDGRSVVVSASDSRAGEEITIQCDSKSGKQLKNWSKSAIPLFFDARNQPIFTPNVLARRALANGAQSVESFYSKDEYRARLVERDARNRVLNAQNLGENIGSALWGGDFLATLAPREAQSLALWKWHAQTRRLSKIASFGERSAQPLGIEKRGENLEIFTPRGALRLDLNLEKTGFQKSARPASEVLQSWAQRDADLPVAPDGKRIERGNLRFSDGKSVALRAPERNPETPGEMRELGQILSVAWSFDSQTLAVVSGTWDGSDSDDGLFLFDARGKFLRQIPAEDPFRLQIRAVAFSPDGRRLATVANEEIFAAHTTRSKKRARLDFWDVASGKPQNSTVLEAAPVWEMQGGTLSSVAFSPDGKLVGAGGVVLENGIFEPHLLIFNAQNGQKTLSLLLNNGFLPATNSWVWLDSQRIALLRGPKLEVWNVRNRLLQTSRFLVPQNGEVVLQP